MVCYARIWSLGVSSVKTATVLLHRASVKVYSVRPPARNHSSLKCWRMAAMNDRLQFSEWRRANLTHWRSSGTSLVMCLIVVATKSSGQLRSIMLWNLPDRLHSWQWSSLRRSRNTRSSCTTTVLNKSYNMGQQNVALAWLSLPAAGSALMATMECPWKAVLVVCSSREIACCPTGIFPGLVHNLWKKQLSGTSLSAQCKQSLSVPWPLVRRFADILPWVKQGLINARRNLRTLAGRQHPLNRLDIGKTT